MPRVIFRASPVPSTFLNERNGKTLQGQTIFEVLLYDPGEDTSYQGHPGTAGPLSQWRREMEPGKPFQLHPPSGFGMPTMVVPDALLATLPDSAMVQFNWTFEPRKP